MEHLVLKVLTFDVAVPTTNWFCDHFLTDSDADSKVKALAMVNNMNHYFTVTLSGFIVFNFSRSLLEGYKFLRRHDANILV